MIARLLWLWADELVANLIDSQADYHPPPDGSPPLAELEIVICREPSGRWVARGLGELAYWAEGPTPWLAISDVIGACVAHAA